MLPESLCALIAVAIVIYDRPITVTTDTAKSPALYAGGGGSQGEILIVAAQWHIPRKVKSRDIAGAVVQAADLIAVLARVCGEVPRDCWIEIVDGADIHESDRMRRRPVDKDVRIRSLAAQIVVKDVGGTEVEADATADARRDWWRRRRRTAGRHRRIWWWR